MRKYLIGIIIGLILALPLGAHAEELVNMIGKQVSGAFPIKVGDKVLDNQAVVIEGVSYLPVRSFGEAVGYDVQFDAELGITMTKSVTVDVYAEELKQLRQENNELLRKREQIGEEIGNKEIESSNQYAIYMQYENPIYIESIKNTGMPEADKIAYDAAKQKSQSLKAEAEALKPKLKEIDERLEEIRAKLTELIEQQKSATQTP